jgi:class 3 adenylate cyclase
MFDPRGLGYSQRSPINYSIETFLEDLRTVVDATGLGGFDLWGEMDASVLALTAATRWPERVRSLVVWFGYPAPTDMIPHDTFKFLDGMVDMNWRLFVETVVKSIGGWSSPDAPRLAQSILDSLDREVWREFLATSWEWDATPLLDSIGCPVLVMQRTDHPLFPVDTSTRLAARIPGANLQLLPGNAMYPWVGDFESILAVLNDFIPIAEPDIRSTRNVFHTVLFTDLVGHTEMMSRLGDERGRDVLREHERITREVLKAHGGTEVKTMGDGFMASFGSVTRAVECAIALQRAFAEREGEPLSVRVGLNAGEPIEEDGDLFGATVILASRIAAKAEGSEILVADTVRGLCSGKGFLFANRGAFVAKGFEEPVRVFEVRWRE